ncbi:MAG: AraC family transcriptional regulator [Myxococcota bacterium]
MSIEMSARIGAMIVHSAAASGADPRALEAATGFRAASAEDPDLRIGIALESALWSEAERLTGDVDFGLHTAERIQPGAFDVLDYAVRTAPTLAAALERLARYNRLEHDVAEFAMVDLADPPRTRVVHGFGAGRPGQAIGQHRHSIEFTLASLVVIGTQLAGRRLVPLAVELHHPRPPSSAEHERVFGCKPRFAAPENALELAAADLAAPVPAADPRLWRVIERHAEALLAARPAPAQSMAARVAREVTAALGEGAPTLAAIAQRMRMSERSLQRRLKDEGVSFDGLVEGLRRELALSYLADPKVAISEVAYLLGYSEPSAFHRAFKRWTGTTPGEVRAPSAARA